MAKFKIYQKMHMIILTAMERTALKRAFTKEKKMQENNHCLLL